MRRLSRSFVTRMGLSLAGMITVSCFSWAESGLTERVGSLVNLHGDNCVATLLDDSLLLTAAHCLFDETGRILRLDELSFQRPQGETRAIAGFAIHQGFDSTSEPSVSTIAADLALLRLTQPIDGLTEMPRGQIVYKGDTVLLGFRDGLVPCLVESQVGSVFALDCRVALGDSGVAVFRERLAGPERGEIIGVVSAYETANDVNSAIAGEILIDLKELEKRLPSPVVHETETTEPIARTRTPSTEFYTDP